MMFAGAAIRQFFVMRHGYKLGRNPHPWPYAAVGVAVLIGTAIWLKPAPQPAPAAANIAPVGQVVMQGEQAAAPRGSAAPQAPVGSYENVHAIMQKHCMVCHSVNTIAQKNVKFDTAEEIKSHAQQIYTQVVQLRKMPFGNPGALSDEERSSFKQWFESGAAVR
jgi:uncharacterized membrane protein